MCYTAVEDAMRLHANHITAQSPVMSCLGEQPSTNMATFITHLYKINASPVIDQLCHSRVVVAIELLELDHQAPRLMLQPQRHVCWPRDIEQCCSELLHRRYGGHSCSVGALTAPCG